MIKFITFIFVICLLYACDGAEVTYNKSIVLLYPNMKGYDNRFSKRKAIINSVNSFATNHDFSCKNTKGGPFFTCRKAKVKISDKPCYINIFNRYKNEVIISFVCNTFLNKKYSEDELDVIFDELDNKMKSMVDVTYWDQSDYLTY